MKTAVDSSVLLTIFNGEKDAHAWARCMIRSRREGQIVICEVVYAELAPAFATESELQEALTKLGVNYEPISPASAWLAGRMFRVYRNEGGPGQHLIPDFLIAAHARVHADRLATVDRGYLRQYFSDLPLAVP